MIAAHLEERRRRNFGRRAVNPELMVRALLICLLYSIVSFWRLLSAISENICYLCFCFRITDVPVFDLSTVTCFINLIGRDGFSEVFDGLHHRLLWMRLSSPEMYVDSGMVGVLLMIIRPAQPASYWWRRSRCWPAAPLRQPENPGQRCEADGSGCHMG